MTMPTILSMIVIAPPLPYGYLWEILFAAILGVNRVLAIKYPSFGKRWILLLFVVGVAEMKFSFSTHGYNILVTGLIIGLVTAYSGFIIPALYLAKAASTGKANKNNYLFYRVVLN